ncbi:MAG: phosphonate transporter, ATPase subunit [Firmicutes bacterium]|nr:phosphonate transporter, ATPase subunit [Bacillota bacterium]
MIEISNLGKEYTGTKALRNVSLTVKPGEFVVLLGPSGAGKSTLLRCINGLVKPTDGEVIVQGVPVHETKRLESVRSKVGMIFQQFNLVKRLTVLENVLCGCLAHTNVFTSCLKLFSEQDIDYALQCLKRVGLEHKAYQRADQLSGGQQQRVGIARALAQRPTIVLADEPVASLDPKSAERVLDILRVINKQDAITVVVSLHNIELATKYAERIVGLREGTIVFDQPAASLTESEVEQIYGATEAAEEEELYYKQVTYAHA